MPEKHVYAVAIASARTGASRSFLTDDRQSQFRPVLCLTLTVLYLVLYMPYTEYVRTDIDIYTHVQYMAPASGDAATNTGRNQPAAWSKQTKAVGLSTT